MGDVSQRGRVLGQFPGKSLNGRQLPFNMDGNTAGCIGNPAMKRMGCGQLVNKGPEPDPLYNTVDIELFGNFHAFH